MHTVFIIIVIIHLFYYLTKNIPFGKDGSATGTYLVKFSANIFDDNIFLF